MSEQAQQVGYRLGENLPSGVGLASKPACEPVTDDGPHQSDHDAIHRYLDELRQLTSWHPDHRDLLDEGDDHLRTRADNLERVHHLTREHAQAEAVAAFGTPVQFALELARSRSGALAMPTPATRAGGVAAWTAAPLLAFATAALSVTELDVWDTDLFLVGMLALMVGLVSLAAGLIGLVIRVGAPPPVKVVAGCVALSWALLWPAHLLAWVTVSLLLTPAVAFLIHRSHRITGCRTHLTWILAAGWPTVAVVIGALYWNGLATFDPNLFDGFAWGVLTGVMLMSIGSAALGHQLLSEPSVSERLLPDPPVPMATPFAPGRQSGLLGAGSQ